MNWIELKAKFNKYKCKFAIGIIIILFIKALSAWTTYYLEKKEEVVKMPIVEIETKDLFNESRNYIIKRWKDWKKIITYKINPNNPDDKEIFEIKTEIEPIEQKELRWNYKFENSKTDISNIASDYLSYINKKDWKSANKLYKDFSNFWIENTKQNFEKVLLLKDNLKIVGIKPSYDIYTSKGIVKVETEWKVEDKLLWEKKEWLDIYFNKNWDNFEFYYKAKNNAMHITQIKGLLKYL